MAILNITYHGMSTDLPGEVEGILDDGEIRKIAVEVVRTGGAPGLQIANLADDAFDGFVVDRFDTPEGGERIYLRPKVPFGVGAGATPRPAARHGSGAATAAGRA
ncbi:MAG TPA: hypothetical protein VMD59_05130 [Acidimicrobiales bacterium]|nr:hypothetical protein [Acidimicrobiales bacterium]